MMNTKDIIKKYGQPGPESLVLVRVPFPLIVAWDTTHSVNKIQCHRLISDNIVHALTEILNVYGLDRINELRINLYGGCYNYRKMRGGTDWSRHSWGIAIDLDPEENQLTWGKDRARFARPEYQQMIDIFYKHNFLSLGREKNYDWMHFEIAS